jgi:tRNA (guanine37-N1)-methyltransferase
LTGGEIPAMVLTDAMSRLIPDVVGSMNAVRNDSFFTGMLDNQHYTRPAEWRGMKVPEVLVSGNQYKIKEWRRRQAIQRNIDRRPDLRAKADLRAYIDFYTLFIVSGRIDEERMFEVSEMCRANGAIKNFLVSDGLSFENYKRVKNFEQVINVLFRKYNGKYPFIVDLKDNQNMGIIDWADLKINFLKADLPVLFIYKIEPEFWKYDILALTFRKLSGAV